MPKSHRHLFEQMVALPNLFAAGFFADLEMEVVTLLIPLPFISLITKQATLAGRLSG